MPQFDVTTVDALDFLEALEVRNIIPGGQEIQFSCPFPDHMGGDENPSCYMNVETKKFFCHGCKERGDAVSFTWKLLEISPIEAIRLLKERYQPGYINPDARSMQEEVRKILATPPEEEVEQPHLEEKILREYEVDWEKVATSLSSEENPPVPEAMRYIMEERRFDWRTLNHWQVGYDAYSDRVAIPVRDEDGTLIGFKGRTPYPDRKPKYLVLGDRPGKPERYGFPCYHTSHVVFGLDKIYDKDLIVCEGELNVISLAQKYIVDAVALNGSNLSDTQAKLIRKHANSVTLFFDSDSAGRDATRAAIAAFKDFVPVYVVPEHEGDPASMTHEEICDVLDRRETWHRMLLRSRQ